MERLKSLDGARLIMAIVIMWGHCVFIENYSIGEVYKKYLSNAYLALNFFFMLSGFGIYYSNYTKPGLVQHIDFNSCLVYAIKKMVKIYPLYIYSMLLFIPVYVKNGEFFSYLSNFFIDLSLLQSLAPLEHISHGVNGVTWFLSVLFILYIVAPACFKIIRDLSIHKALIFCIILAGMGGVFYTLRIYLKEISSNLGFLIDIGSTPYERVWVFLIGMLLAKLFIHYRYEIKKVTKRLEIPIIFAIVTYNIMKVSIENYVGIPFVISVFDTFICVLLIVTLASESGSISRFLKSDIIQKLRYRDIFIYLLHYPLLLSIKYIAPLVYIIISFGQYNWIIDFTILVLLTCFASIIYDMLVIIKDKVHHKKSVQIKAYNEK